MRTPFGCSVAGVSTTADRYAPLTSLNAGPVTT